MDKKRQGLSAAEVLVSREEHGQNVLTPPKRPSMWRLYLEKYEDPMVRILLVAAVVSLMLAFVKQDFLETVGIIAAVVLATTVGFYFERDAARKFDVLTQLGEEQPVKVIRSLTPAPSLTPNPSPKGEGDSKGEGSDYKVMEIPRRDVVVGDIVMVETGDEIPADGKLLEAIDLQVDESSLTGEAMTNKEVRCKMEDGRCSDISPQPSDIRGEEAYPKDMLLRSSMVMSGSGLYVVTAVGDETEIGHVARQSTEITGVKTPLNIQLDRLAKLISKVGIGLSAAAFVVFLVHDILTDELWHTTDYVSMTEVVLKYFMMAVTLIVMAVPEGLPMAVTLALALNMRRMLKSNNLVRKLQASETMGAVTCICTDKTGTLTENRMTVSDVRCMMDDGRGSDLSPQPSDLYKAIALNTTATHDVGNPTEQALLRWLVAQGVDYQKLREAHPITAREPFSTERKYMSTTVGDTVYIKGAPEIVMAMCKMTDEERQQAEAQLAEWQQHAMRTLAIAENSQLLAIVAISDPLRKEVPAAIRQCRQAGIDVKIVTGDTTATAMEIAQQCGIIEVRGERDSQRHTLLGREEVRDKAYITGAEFAALSDDEALQMVKGLKVMSRARPTDKQRLVALLQQHGEVVAVTGDGTNDAPALNRAHVGLSLGSGTSVAKEASDITLIDDSFRSIVHAVMWGRSLYKNIQRFIFFQLVVNVTALLLVLCGAFVGTEMPLTITQILWVNLIMDTFAAMALASLPPSREVMRERPRSQDAFIITRPMIRGIGIIGGLFFVVTFALLYYFERIAGVDPKELTIFFCIFVMLQWWNLFNARSLGSCHSAFRRLWACRGFLFVLAMVLAGQWLIVTFGGKMFRTVPLEWPCWGWIILGTSPVLWVGEVYRLIVRMRKA
jgi:Ca2+-transporting ATPase